MILAVDTGGTKTLITSFDKSGKIIDTFKFPTPPSKEDYLVRLVATIRTKFDLNSIETIVLGLPGIVKDDIVVWCNSLKWADFDVISKLKEQLETDIPMHIENDANLAGLGEARMRSPVPESLLYITVSTGIGTGIIVNGHISEGTRLTEGGRMKFLHNGQMQEWEQFASGKAIYNKYQSYAKDITDSDAWSSISRNISVGLLVSIPLLQPDIIVVGGSIGTYFDRYSASLRQIISKNLPDHIPVPTIEGAIKAEEAVTYGCYYYGLDTVNNQ